jgi:hypothetical protein
VAAVSRSWRALAVLAAGAALLALAWSLAPPSTPPLYDGGPIIAEPYRYCQPPAGLSGGKTPGSIDQALPVQGGQSPAMAETTDEQPSQAQLLAPQGAFAVPPGTTSLHVTIRCVPPPPVPLLGGNLDGNVYSIVVAAGATPLPIRPGQQVTMVLRGPAGVPNVTLELYSGGAWTRLDTQPLGNTAPDSYAANVSQLGDFALVAAPTPGSAGGGSGGGVAVVVIVAVVVAAGGTLLLLRSRSRPQAPRRRR